MAVFVNENTVYAVPAKVTVGAMPVGLKFVPASAM
jgi:hypothetical protein